MIEYIVPFESGGIKFDFIHCDSAGMKYGSTSGIQAFSLIDEYPYADVYDEMSGWNYEAYRTVDFGIVPKLVTVDFYNWFISQAEKI